MYICMHVYVCMYECMYVCLPGVPDGENALIYMDEILRALADRGQVLNLDFVFPKNKNEIIHTFIHSYIHTYIRTYMS